MNLRSLDSSIHYQCSVYSVCVYVERDLATCIPEGSHSKAAGAPTMLARLLNLISSQIHFTSHHESASTCAALPGTPHHACLSWGNWMEWCESHVWTRYPLWLWPWASQSRDKIL